MLFYNSSDYVLLTEFYGTSNDTKPTTGYATGSSFVEVDTGKLFLYDEESGDWTEVSGGGGGGGGGSSDFSTCKITSSGEGYGDILKAILVDNDIIYVGVIAPGSEYNVILYKGSYYLEYDDTNVSVTIVSGDAELTTYDEAPVIHITGDCEILVNLV